MINNQYSKMVISQILSWAGLWVCYTPLVAAA